MSHGGTVSDFGLYKVEFPISFTTETFCFVKTESCSTQFFTNSSTAAVRVITQLGPCYNSLSKSDVYIARNSSGKLCMVGY